MVLAAIVNHRDTENTEVAQRFDQTHTTDQGRVLPGIDIRTESGSDRPKIQSENCRLDTH